MVDDDPVVRASCRKILEAEGHRVRLCESAPQAMAELGRQDWQLLVVDVILPEYDGLRLIDDARRQAPAVPVLVMSGYRTPETVADGRRAGAAHFIAKPFTPAEFSAAVAQALGGRREQ